MRQRFDYSVSLDRGMQCNGGAASVNNSNTNNQRVYFCQSSKCLLTLSLLLQASSLSLLSMSLHASINLCPMRPKNTIFFAKARVRERHKQPRAGRATCHRPVGKEPEACKENEPVMRSKRLLMHANWQTAKKLCTLETRQLGQKCKLIQLQYRTTHVRLSLNPYWSLDKTWSILDTTLCYSFCAHIPSDLLGLLPRCHHFVKQSVLLSCSLVWWLFKARVDRWMGARRRRIT